MLAWRPDGSENLKTWPYFIESGFHWIDQLTGWVRKWVNWVLEGLIVKLIILLLWLMSNVCIIFELNPVKVRVLPGKQQFNIDCQDLWNAGVGAFWLWWGPFMDMIAVHRRLLVDSSWEEPLVKYQTCGVCSYAIWHTIVCVALVVRSENLQWVTRRDALVCTRIET